MAIGAEDGTLLAVSRRLRLRLGSAAALAPVLLFLAACTGGGGGGGGQTACWEATTTAVAGVARDVVFNPTLADQYLADDEFNAADADFTGCPSSQSNPYALVNLHIARSAGLDGTGQRVAIVDSGFRTAHQDFTGKDIVAFGTLPGDNHGAHVASLIAAIEDGNGMMGVAPGVALHLTSYEPNGTFNLAHIVAGTLDAANMGAIAQNNSWGFSVSAQAMQTYLNNNPGEVAAGLASLIGYSEPGWQDYLDALDQFQQTGVIVFAVSNESPTDVLAALPTFEPLLNEAWIAVVNGYFEVNNSGAITHADLLSAECGLAARYCIAADGTTFGAQGNSSNYGAGTGTSYAAPIVSGGIALVAEAFPTLTPEEITTRILASADNTWFAAEGVNVNGTVNFGGGITHDYSNIWGHGVLDLAAALSPLGTVSIVLGDSLATGRRAPLDSAGVAVSTAFGDALARGLAEREMTVFDHFNGNFVIDADALVRERGAGGLDRVTDLVRVGAGDFDPVGGTPSLAGGVVEAAYGRDALAASSVLGLSRNAGFVSSGDGGWSTFAYAGGQQATDNVMAGFGLARTFEAFGGRLTIGASQNIEQGALLGLVGNEAFDFGRGTSITAGHLGYERAVGDRFSVFANVEVGIANAFGLAGDSLVRSIGPVGFNGFNFGATAHGVIADGDRLTFSVSRPLRVASGEMAIGMPVGRTIDGTVTTEVVTLSLAPGGRQLDLGVNYEIGLGAASTLRLAATYSLDAGNVDGARGLALAAGIGIGF